MMIANIALVICGIRLTMIGCKDKDADAFVGAIAAFGSAASFMLRGLL